MVERTDRATLIDAVAGEDWPIDLSGAVVDESGWENVVLATRDGWILRFPRQADTAFDREVALLRRLRGRLPVQIPEVRWTGTRVRVAVYRKITGAAFDPVSYGSAPIRERDRLAESMVDFLVAMHGALTAEEIAELGVPDVDYAQMYEFVMAGIDVIPAEHRVKVDPIVAAYADIWVTGAVGGTKVVLHNDFHQFNMVFGEPVGRVAGIWDFTCVLLGVPTFEFRYFAAGSCDLLDRISRYYTARTGSPIDLRAATVANRMENIYDALSAGRPETLYAAFQRWDEADAGL